MSGTAAGGLVGASLGLLGEVASVPVRAGIATAGGLVLLVTAVWAVRVPQVDRETSQHILDAGPYRWAFVNGALLGAAVTSRLGFWLWYAVPLFAFSSGRWQTGLIVYATYAGARMLTINMLAWRMNVIGDSQAVMGYVLALRPLARRVCRCAAVVLGTLFVIAFGI